MSGGNKYLYDGKEYGSLEELPTEARSLYRMYNADGLLDIYSAGDEEESERPAKFEIDGQKYNSLDELPLDVKEKLIAKIAKLERNGLRLIIDDNRFPGGTPPAMTKPANNFSEAPISEVSSAIRYKLFLGLVILAAAIFFIYIFISSYLKTQ